MTQKQFDKKVGATLRKGLRKAVDEQIEALQRKLERLSMVARGTAEYVEVNRKGYTIKRTRVRPTTYYRMVAAS